MRSHRRKEDATLWLRPTGGPTINEWIDVCFADYAEMRRQIETVARQLMPGDTVKADTSTLDTWERFGRIHVSGRQVAIFGFYRRTRPEQHPAPAAPATAPDEPAESALFAPPPPPLHIPTGGTLT